ncbi:MAG: heme exporter protein CcmD [Oleiphilus sp.]|nr:MAG: heme exporter protein CcmD [Oleiphilus sp.]
MSFESWQDFWHMGGHGLYVWLCYGVGLLVILGIALAPVWQRKRLVRKLYQQYKRQSRNQGKDTSSVQIQEVSE